MRRILVVGDDSYIGSSFLQYINRNYPLDYDITGINLKIDDWKRMDFSIFHAVLDCVGVAHIRENKKNEHLYYEVNRDLAIEIAKKAKADGVKRFLLLSSMAVYGLTTGMITKETAPHPCNAYGKSKLEADIEIQKLTDNSFSFMCIRPPMVYGKNCKGKYNSLQSIALKSPIFPEKKNQRSMIYIQNLCEFIKHLIDHGTSGIYFPQNKDYVCTSEMVKLIAETNGKKIISSILLGKILSPMIKRNSVLQKAFGSLIYESKDAFDFQYCIYDLKSSIEHIYH